MKNSYIGYKIPDRIDSRNIRYKFSGQSLLEILLASALGVILIGSSINLIGTSLRFFNSAKQNLQANSLIRQEAEIIQSLARDNWHSIYDLTKDSNYYATSTNNIWSFAAGEETSTINNIPYKRYFKVYNVYRDSNGNIATSGLEDPSTQKITVFLDYGNNYGISSNLSFYLTRSSNNQVLNQTDWSGGPNQTGPIPYPGNKFDSADSNINYASTTGSIYMTEASTTPASLISSIIDTGVSGGAGFNSFLWQGSLGTNGSVKLMFAFSNSSSGPWTYYGCTTASQSLCLDSNNWTTSDSSVASFDLDTSYPFPFSSTFQNKRYFRYKVILSTSGTTPQVNDIIINWSP